MLKVVVLIFLVRGEGLIHKLLCTEYVFRNEGFFFFFS